MHGARGGQNAAEQCRACRDTNQLSLFTCHFIFSFPDRPRWGRRKKNTASKCFPRIGPASNAHFPLGKSRLSAHRLSLVTAMRFHPKGQVFWLGRHHPFCRPSRDDPVALVWRRTLPLQRRDRRGITPLSLLSCRRNGRHLFVSVPRSGRKKLVVL